MSHSRHSSLHNNSFTYYLTPSIPISQNQPPYNSINQTRTNTLKSDHNIHLIFANKTITQIDKELLSIRKRIKDLQSSSAIKNLIPNSIKVHSQSQILKSKFIERDTEPYIIKQPQPQKQKKPQTNIHINYQSQNTKIISNFSFEYISHIDYKEELNITKTQLQTKDIIIKSLTKENEELKQKLIYEQNDNNEFNKEIQNIKKKYEREIKEIKDTLSAYNNRNNDIVEENEKLKSEMIKLKNMNGKAKQDKINLEKNILILTNHNQQLQKSNDELKQRVFELLNVNKTLQKNYDDLSNNILLKEKINTLKPNTTFDTTQNPSDSNHSYLPQNQNISINSIKRSDMLNNISSLNYNNSNRKTNLKEFTSLYSRYNKNKNNIKANVFPSKNNYININNSNKNIDSITNSNNNNNKKESLNAYKRKIPISMKEKEDEHKYKGILIKKAQMLNKRTMTPILNKRNIDNDDIPKNCKRYASLTKLDFNENDFILKINKEQMNIDDNSNTNSKIEFTSHSQSHYINKIKVNNNTQIVSLSSNLKHFNNNSESLIFRVYDCNHLVAFDQSQRRLFLIDITNNTSDFNETFSPSKTIQLNSTPSILFIITGANCDLLYEFNYEEQTLIKLNKLNYNHLLGGLIQILHKNDHKDDYLLCLSGVFNKKVEKLSLHSKYQWESLNNTMIIERCECSYCIVDNKYIYAIFGFNWLLRKYLNTIEYCNVGDIKWKSVNIISNLNNIPMNIKSHCMFQIIDNKAPLERFVVLGGYDGFNNAPIESYIEIDISHMQREPTIELREINRKIAKINKNKIYLFSGDSNGKSNNNGEVCFFDNELRLHMINRTTILHDIFYLS